MKTAIGVVLWVASSKRDFRAFPDVVQDAMGFALYLAQSGTEGERVSDVTIERGGDSVFADLGFPDADTHLLKAQLVSRMIDVMNDRKLNQVQTARLVGLSQPDISRIARGHFRDISVERILRLLTRLGCEVDIDVRPQGRASAFPTIVLEAAA